MATRTRHTKHISGTTASRMKPQYGSGVPNQKPQPMQRMSTGGIQRQGPSSCSILAVSSVNYNTTSTKLQSPRSRVSSQQRKILPSTTSAFKPYSSIASCPVQSTTAAQPAAGVRALQPTVTFNSSSRICEKESLASQHDQQSKISANDFSSQRAQISMVSQVPLALDLIAPPTSGEKNGNQQSSNKQQRRPPTAVEYQTLNHPSPQQHIKFQMIEPVQMTRKEVWTENRVNERLKFQLDGPIMPLDFVSSPTKTSFEELSEDQTLVKQSEANSPSADQKKQVSLGQITIAQVGSLQELLKGNNRLSNPLETKCFENDFKVLHNSPSEKSQLPPFLLQKVTPSHFGNEDYITTFKSKNPARNRAGTNDTTFSFACLPRTNKMSPSNDRSQGGAGVLETDGSYNINTTRQGDNECLARQKPLPTSTKRRIMQTHSSPISLPQSKMVMRQTPSAPTSYNKYSPAKCHLLNQRPKIISKVEVAQDESLLDCSESPVRSVNEEESDLCDEDIDGDQERRLIVGTPKNKKLQRILSNEFAIKDTPEIQIDGENRIAKSQATSQPPVEVLDQEKDGKQTFGNTPRLSISQQHLSAFERALNKLGKMRTGAAPQTSAMNIQSPSSLIEDQPSKMTHQLIDRLGISGGASAAQPVANHQKGFKSARNGRNSNQPLNQRAVGYDGDIRQKSNQKRAVSAHSANVQATRRRSHRQSVQHTLRKKEQTKSIQSPCKIGRQTKMQQPNLAHQFEPQTELETQRNSIAESAPMNTDPKFVEELQENSGPIDSNCELDEAIDDLGKDELIRGLLSKSLEPKPNRGNALILTSQVRSSNVQMEEAYKDDYNTSQSSRYMSQRAKVPYQINVLNLVPAATEPCNSTYRGGGCSIHNNSIGPNDDTNSQISSNRYRRAQYHRLLTAGKVEEVQRQISIEIQSNNQDAMTLYTKAKLAEKQGNYEQAIEDFGKVLELDPSFFNAGYGKAKCENIIGRDDDAIESYNLALAKDVDIRVTQTYNSRLSSKRSSPHRMSRKPSKLFGGSQSPFRLRQFESTNHDCFTQASFFAAEDFANKGSIGQGGGQPICVCKNNLAPARGNNNNILEEVSEHSGSPYGKQPLRILAKKHHHNDDQINTMPIEIIESSYEEEEKHDEDTPQFDNEKLLSCDRIKEKIGSSKFTTASPSCKGLAVGSIDGQKAAVKQGGRRGTNASDKEQPSFLGLKIENCALSNKKSSIYSSAATSRNGGKSYMSSQSKSSKTTVKKGVKRRAKQPLQWPANALPSTKRSTAKPLASSHQKVFIDRGIAKMSVDQLIVKQSRHKLQQQQQIPSSAKVLVNQHQRSTQSALQPFQQASFGRPTLTGTEAEQASSITLIGQVNIQMTPQSITPLKQAQNMIRRQALNKGESGKMSTDNKDQKILRQTSSNAMQTVDKPRDSLGKHDSHNVQIVGRQESFGNKGGLLGNDSFLKTSTVAAIGAHQQNQSMQEHYTNGKLSLSGLPQAISAKNFTQPAQKASIRLLQTGKDEKNHTNGCFDKTQQSSLSESKRNSIQSRSQLGIFSNPSSQDFTRAYKRLSNQLFDDKNQSATDPQRQQMSVYSESHVAAAVGAQKSNLLSQNVSVTEPQPEWFLLAMSSYKMKKYGECLFAVSKAVRAPPRKELASVMGASSETVFSASPEKTQRLVGNQITLEDLGGFSAVAVEDHLHDGQMRNFDADGNLSRQGQSQLGYLKAKCLFKLFRYSESLFQLAKIWQLSKEENLLSERQQLKMHLYKSMCLIETKQFKQAVQMLNKMLARIEPDQCSLLDDMRESQFEQHKPLANLLIQAYSYRGRANKELQDYEQALQDFNKLLELCQFQDLPTEKVFEYMTERAAVSARLNADSSPSTASAAFRNCQPQQKQQPTM